MTTILTPIDFSSGTRHVIAEAAALAEATKGQIVLLHVLEPLQPVADEYGFSESGAELAAVAEKDALAKLVRLQGRLKRMGIRASTCIDLGSPGRKIVEQAGRISARYVVIGSRGHGAFYDLVAGSTAHRVLKEAPCPVLVVTPVRKKGKSARLPALAAVEALGV